MRRALLITTAAATAVLAGCSQPADQPPPATTTTNSAPAPAPVEAPPAPGPVAGGPCPYLDTADVAWTNGQRVSTVRISGGEPPACYFYGLDGAQQLMVRVYTGQPAVATAVVDAAAPVDTANPANRPAGWKGGYQSGDDGAVYAVAKGATAVVARTNQGQSVKAREVVQRTISALGL